MYRSRKFRAVFISTENIPEKILLLLLSQPIPVVALYVWHRLEHCMCVHSLHSIYNLSDIQIVCIIVCWKMYIVHSEVIFSQCVCVLSTITYKSINYSRTIIIQRSSLQRENARINTHSFRMQISQPGDERLFFLFRFYQKYERLTLAGPSQTKHSRRFLPNRDVSLFLFVWMNGNE